jgi:fatty-acyl-CoA synthase
MMYGLTENTSNATIDPRDGPVKAGCSGIRVPYTTIRIVAMDDDGGVASECAIGETGMVVVAGPGVAAGYVDPTQDRGSFMADGSFVTGDLGSVDADGYLRIVGRRKDLIIRGGHNIDPSQIEHALMQAPAVALAAAVGKPDPHAGELPIAYVQLHEGAVATAAELLAFASPRILERAAIPKEIIIVDRIPLSAVGKPLKYQLAADAASRALHAALRDVPGSWTLDVEPCRGGGMRAVVRVGDTTPATRTAIERIMATFTTPFVVIDAAAEGPAVAAGMAR